MNHFSIADIILISAYVVLILVISFLVAGKKQKTSAEYFFAGKDMGALAVGTSLFISHISVAHFLGFLNNAWSPLFVEWLAIPALLLLGWIFAPFYLKRKVETVPQIFEQAYNRSIRFIVSSVSIIFYIFVKIAIILFAGSFLLSTFFNWEISTSVYLMLILTGFYVVVSGFRGILFTQIFQAVIVLAGVVSIAVFGLMSFPLSGEQVLLESQIWLKPWVVADIPLSAILVGAPIIFIWYWSVDQYMVQRVLSAQSPEKARAATIFAGFLSLVYFVFFIGFCFLLSANFSNNPLSNSAFGPVSILFSAAGIKGMLLVIILSLMMSSLAATINSAATLFTFDFYKTLNPEASDRKIVLVGRLFSMIIVITGIIMLPVLKVLDISIYQNLLIIPAYIASPIVAVFMFGIFSKKANAAGASWTFGSAAILIIIRLIGDFKILSLGQIGPINFLLNIHYLYFTFILFGFSSLVMFLSGNMLKINSEKDTSEKQWNSVFKINEAISVKNQTITLNVVLSFFLAALSIGFWVIFS